MPLYTTSVPLNRSLPDACNQFLETLGEWMHASVDRFGSAPATDVHDQGTYMTGWEPFIKATRDERALAFMKTQRDRICNHFVESGQWRHGYWTMHEAHHGTEHYELFLGSLLRLDPADNETGRQLTDAAEHMGNWSKDLPDWFNYKSRRFHSLFFGAQGIRSEPGMDLNTPDHLRCINICLLAYAAGGDQRYLDFAALYAGEWADAILADEKLPIGLMDTGPIYDFAGDDEAIYRSFMGEVGDLDDPVNRAENFLTSDTINTFLNLGRKTGHVRFRHAAERLLDVLSTQLVDPDAGVVADAIRRYRQWTGNARYDGAILSAVKQLAPAGVRELSLDTDTRLARKPAGVGKRSDMPRWLEDGIPRRHNPITLAVAAEIQGDEQLAAQAVGLAHAAFLLSCRAFPDGRDHGCAARTVSAIARGHGRDNHAGMTTAVLGPIMECFSMI
jgi:hypothetical protein